MIIFKKTPDKEPVYRVQGSGWQPRFLAMYSAFSPGSLPEPEISTHFGFEVALGGRLH